MIEGVEVKLDNINIGVDKWYLWKGETFIMPKELTRMVN
jgi:hypothetical protein